MTDDHNPYQAPVATPQDSSVSQRSPRQQLLPVAITLLVVSILHMIGGLFYFVFVYGIVAAPDADPLEAHMLTVYCMYYGITMLYSFLLATGAFSMMRQGSYLWAMTICVLSLVPIMGPCYFMAIPIGIWGIVVLRRPAVRDSFARM